MFGIALWLRTQIPLSLPPLAFGSRDPQITVFVVAPPKWYSFAKIEKIK